MTERQIIKWLKFCLVVSITLWVALAASFRPKQQPCQCNCEKPSISTTTLQVTYDK